MKESVATVLSCLNHECETEYLVKNYISNSDNKQGIIGLGVKVPKKHTF